MRNLLICLITLLPGLAAAQIPPRAAEVSRYTGLHAAAHRGDVADIERLITAKADLNARDAYGRTPLHVATHAGKVDAIRTLIKAGANHALLENDRYDAVTIASVANNEDALRMLLSLGASAKLITSRYDGTALIAAAHLGHAGVVKQLIAAGAPLDHVNNLHWTALIESIVLGDGVWKRQVQQNLCCCLAHPSEIAQVQVTLCARIMTVVLSTIVVSTRRKNVRNADAQRQGCTNKRNARVAAFSR